MNLGPRTKSHIDSLSHFDLLKGLRFAAAGDPWFQSETGRYWIKRLKQLRTKNPAAAVADSKSIGWDIR